MKTSRSWMFSSQRLAGLLAVGFAMCLALVWASPALARQVYVNSTVFEENFLKAMQSSNNKTFTTLRSIAVDNSSGTSKGDIYVVDSGSPPHGVVDKLEVNGSSVKFLCELGGSNMESPGTKSKPCALGKQVPEALTTLDGVAAGPNGEVYLVNPTTNKVEKFNASGEYEYQLKETEAGKALSKAVAVAVGLGGEVYVADSTTLTVDRFSKTGVFEYAIKCGTKNETIGTTRESICGTAATWNISDIGGLAVNKEGKVYVVNINTATGGNAVFEFSAAGAYERSLADPEPSSSGIGIEQQTNNFFLAHSRPSTETPGSIEWYNAAGTLEEVFSSQLPLRPETVAGVAPAAAGVLYTGNSGTSKLVERWELGEPPILTTCVATSITASEIRLTSEVSPNGHETKYKFEYGPGSTFTGATAEANAGSGTAPVQVSTTVNKLTPNSAYDCRLIAESSGGRVASMTGKVTTKLAIEGVKTNVAQGVAVETAKIGGSLMPEGIPVEYFLEYGTSTAYGHTTTPQTSSSTREIVVSETLTNLAPLTSYHYRIVAKRTIEGVPYVIDGSDETLTTEGIGPSIIAENASSVTPFAATLEATINPGNSATTYYFVYGTSPFGEQAVLPTSVASGYGSIQVIPREIQALQPDTTYYYHVVAENAFGKVEGVEGPDGLEEVKTFTTLPAFGPEASVGQVGEVGAGSANLTTTVNPNGLATEYEIQLATGSDAYTTVTVLSAGSETTPQTTSYVLSGLAPATTYNVRIVAWNPAGETIGSGQTFTTAAASPSAFAQPVAPLLVAFTPIAEPASAQTATTKVKTKTQTKGRKLANALKTCRKDVNKAKRTRCEKIARKRYGPKAKTKKAVRTMG